MTHCNHIITQCRKKEKKISVSLTVIYSHEDIIKKIKNFILLYGIKSCPWLILDCGNMKKNWPEEQEVVIRWSFQSYDVPHLLVVQRRNSWTAAVDKKRSRYQRGQRTCCHCRTSTADRSVWTSRRNVAATCATNEWRSRSAAGLHWDQAWSNRTKSCNNTNPR